MPKLIQAAREHPVTASQVPARTGCPDGAVSGPGWTKDHLFSMISVNN
jgi:hypothetical protein